MGRDEEGIEHNEEVQNLPQKTSDYKLALPLSEYELEKDLDSRKRDMVIP